MPKTSGLPPCKGLGPSVVSQRGSGIGRETLLEWPKTTDQTKNRGGMEMDQVIEQVAENKDEVQELSLEELAKVGGGRGVVDVL